MDRSISKPDPGPDPATIILDTGPMTAPQINRSDVQETGATVLDINEWNIPQEHPD